MRRIKARTCAFAVACLLASSLVSSLVIAEQVDPNPETNSFLLGGDISALARIEEYHGVYSDNGKADDLISILSHNGCNCSRLRLFVNPNHKNLVVNDLEYTLALAKRVKKAGHVLLLDIHYSDTWADPGKQFTPASWNNLSFEELEKQVTEYTTQVIARFSDEGVMPDIVQIGNEVTNGMLWPLGKIHYDSSDGEERESWKRFCRLLKAGIDGVHSASTASQNVRTMVHIDRGGDWNRTKYFFDNLQRENVEFDMVGQSFYPWWHGRLSELKENLANTAERFKKPIVVVEAGYPYRGRSWITRPNMDWPISPAGQAQFLVDVIEATRETPHGLGAGVVYWYPEAIQVKGLSIWEGGSVGLFDQTGSSLPALKAFSRRVPSTSSLKTGEIR